MWTLSSLQLHEHPMIVVDEDATLELQVKTVKYFRSTEKVARDLGFEQILPSDARTGAKRDRVVEKLASPVDGKTSFARLAVRQHTVPIVRAVTPELQPDAMHNRVAAISG